MTATTAPSRSARPRQTTRSGPSALNGKGTPDGKGTPHGRGTLATPIAPAGQREHSRPSDVPTHSFVVGQAVRLKGGFGVYASRFGDIYRVTGTLPPIGISPQYRIRNEKEQHERVTTEDSLEAVVPGQPGEAAELADRTFAAR